ncbi:ISAs1 family transposase [Dactylosporangium darangshiense]|uniref:ISAs1 family transposase n=1 Tax=Dactylosporangium darangshiense TaxID=579108 RepID=UPI0036456151
MDGKLLRGARLPDGRHVHLLSAYDTDTGIVLAQVAIAAKSNEIPAFTVGAQGIPLAGRNPLTQFPWSPLAMDRGWSLAVRGTGPTSARAKSSTEERAGQGNGGRTSSRMPPLPGPALVVPQRNSVSRSQRNAVSVHITPLLDQLRAQVGSLAGTIIVADALHAQVGHAHAVNVRDGQLMVTVKANQPTLHPQLKQLPWAQVPVGYRTRDRGHGRRETRTVKALTVATPGGLGFPHAEQAVRITRTRTASGKTTRETAYLIVTLPADAAQPDQLGDWARREWHIENRLHWVRDVTLAEDAHQARIGNGPAVAAVLRNTAIGYHRSNGEPNIARATRRANRRTHDLISAVTSTPRTQ